MKFSMLSSFKKKKKCYALATPEDETSALMAEAVEQLARAGYDARLNYSLDHLFGYIFAAEDEIPEIAEMLQNMEGVEVVPSPLSAEMTKIIDANAIRPF